MVDARIHVQDARAKYFSDEPDGTGSARVFQHHHSGTFQIVRTMYTPPPSKPAKKMRGSSGSGRGVNRSQTQVARSSADDGPQIKQHFYVRNQNRKKIEVTDKHHNAAMAIIVFLLFNPHSHNKFMHACRAAVLGHRDRRLRGRN